MVATSSAFCGKFPLFLVFFRSFSAIFRNSKSEFRIFSLQEVATLAPTDPVQVAGDESVDEYLNRFA